MNTYQPDRLLQLWKLEQIDSQMVIGHLLQNLVIQSEALTKLTVTCTRLKVDVDKLAQQIHAQSSTARHQPSKK